MNEDNRKILQTNAQQLVNPEQKGIRNKILSWMLKDVDIDRFNVKHLEVYGKNTLTTPKAVITDSSADPLNDGEITRNGALLKVKTDGIVINIGRAMSLDAKAQNEAIWSSADSLTNIHGGRSISAGYKTLVSKTITVAEDNSTVALCGALDVLGDSTYTSTIKIDEGGSNKVPEDAFVKGVNVCGCHGVIGIVTGVGAGSHTYDFKGKISVNGNSAQWGGSYIGVAVIKLT